MVGTLRTAFYVGFPRPLRLVLFRPPKHGIARAMGVFLETLADRLTGEHDFPWVSAVSDGGANETDDRSAEVRRQKSDDRSAA